MPNTNKKYTISDAKGDKDKTQLDSCYFQLEENSTTLYDFFDKNGNSLKPAITSGTQFGFSFPATPSIDWLITVTIGDTSATGTWSNNDTTQPVIKETDGENGTFTAQAGGGDPAEHKTASTASA